MNAKKKFLVTGVAGFVGFHLANELLQQGHYVYGLDSLDQYYSLELKLERLSTLRKFPEFTFNHLNISEGELIDYEIGKFKPETIFHMAAQAGVRLLQVC